MTPSDSSRWMRFQHGVDDNPTRLPISATESEASSCNTARIFRSMASMLKSPRRLDASYPSPASRRRTFFFDCQYWGFGIINSISGILGLFQSCNPGTATSMSISLPFWRGLLAAFAVLAVGSLAPAPADAQTAAPAARTAPAGPLVSVAWLKSQLSDPDLVVLDIRSALDGGGAEAYLKAHIPGAVHSDYDKAGWRVTRSDIPLMLPTVPELEKLVGETGIDEDSH